MTRCSIGVDIGGTNLRAARVGIDGRVSYHRSEAITRDPEAVIARITALCRDLDDTAVDAIGIGVPGRIDANRQLVLSGGYVDLGGHDLVRRLEDSFGKPVAVGNDCGMALVAEMALGAGVGYGNVVMFTIGTGIGGAVALDGCVIHGAGTAGQLGHITVEPGGQPCNCGRRGCVETTSSGTALGRHLAEAGLPPGTRVETLLDAARQGDGAALTILQRWAGPLRSAIDSMVAAVAPDLVLLGGGLGQAAAAALAHAPAMSPWYQCRVAAAQLGDDAGVIGSALAAVAHARALVPARVEP
ncbi:ROK family protein [Lichenihabitans sp. Uapishka_5]|uniref:ROK family protein n=1 Tax=Lichenihabitans sp. Uapishka_5 TaxID=3037302 RepID=UPI0029E7FFCB|nr:ROK family protein [Lichenihabitans sp. Uapishka_5]